MTFLLPLNGPAPQFTGARPSIDTTADDALLTKLGLYDAGLLYAIDPQAWDGVVRLQPQTLFREKATAKSPITISASVQKIDDVNFNGRRVINTSGVATNVIMPLNGSRASKSCTVVFCGTRPATPRASYVYSTNFVSGSGPRQAIRQTSGGSLSFITSHTDVENNRTLIPPEAMAAPSASDPHVFAFSYDDATRECAAFYDSGSTPVSTATHAAPTTALETDQLFLNGVSTGTAQALAWGAKQARFFYFNNALHLNHERVLVDLVTMLRSAAIYNRA